MSFLGFTDVQSSLVAFISAELVLLGHWLSSKFGSRFSARLTLETLGWNTLKLVAVATASLVLLGMLSTVHGATVAVQFGGSILIGYIIGFLSSTRKERTGR